MPLIGYARVSTEDQTPLPQSQALKSAGCVEIHEEQASGGDRARPVLARVLERIGKGDTLVVETRHFTAGQLYRGVSQESVRLTERFSLIDTDTIGYAVTFEDPDLWTRPWTAVLSLPRTSGPMFEYACHEGNVGMRNTPAISRGEEAARVLEVGAPHCVAERRVGGWRGPEGDAAWSGRPTTSQRHTVPPEMRYRVC